MANISNMTLICYILFGVRIRPKFNYDTSLVLIIIHACMNCVLLSCVTDDLQNSFGKKKQPTNMMLLRSRSTGVSSLT